MYYLQSCVCAPWSDGTVGGPSPVSSEGDDRRDSWTERTNSALARRFLHCCRHPAMSARFANRGWLLQKRTRRANQFGVVRANNHRFADGEHRMIIEREHAFS